MNTAKGQTDYSNSSHRRDWSDLIGRKFSRWTVLEVLPELSSNGSVICKVQCSCDKHTIKNVLLCSLRSVTSRSCGCLRNEETAARFTKNILGMRFGDLTVIQKTDKRRPCDNSVIWLCKCERCGINTREAAATNLILGDIVSCEECARKYRIEMQKKAVTKYVDNYELRLSRILNSMKQRCHNPNDRDYLKYGARGIYVCDEWRYNTRAFIEWAFKNGYKQDLSIDRIDVNGPYCPTNCRWADRFVQANNRRCNVIIESGGMRLTASECSHITGKCASFFSRRPDFGKEYMDDYFRRRDPNLPNALEVVRYRHSLEKFMEINPYLGK